MKHPYTYSISREVKDFLRARLRRNLKLKEQGAILTNSDGELHDVMRSTEGVGLKQVSGYLEYIVRDGSLDIRYIKNRPVKEKNAGELSHYASDRARADGMKMLFDAFMALPGFIKADSLWISTWIIPARPGLLEDPNSCFYQWEPVLPQQHEAMVEYFSRNPVKRLREYNHKANTLVEYRYLLR